VPKGLKLHLLLALIELCCPQKRTAIDTKDCPVTDIAEQLGDQRKEKAIGIEKGKCMQAHSFSLGLKQTKNHIIT
jgi:hypothetical protein